MQKYFFFVVMFGVCLCDYEEVSIERQGTDALSLSVFPSLNSYHVGAKEIPESDYPWLARVIHAREGLFPDVCTASCIEDRIFVTSAKCIYKLKVEYTSIRYIGLSLRAIAFILPSSQSSQMYDDIGFIVVNNDYTDEWVLAEMFPMTNRTDDYYKWFETLDLHEEKDHRVIGFAPLKGSHKLKPHLILYKLVAIDNVYINLQLCSSILTNNLFDGFKVPCYSSCNLKEFKENNEKCTNYLGVEGAAVLVKNQMLGVANWGASSRGLELPVGFTVLNSESFWQDLACARIIRDSEVLLPEPNYFKSICDEGVR